MLEVQMEELFPLQVGFEQNYEDIVSAPVSVKELLNTIAAPVPAFLLFVGIR
jgi:hypothetical protein